MLISAVRYLTVSAAISCKMKKYLFLWPDINTIQSTICMTLQKQFRYLENICQCSQLKEALFWGRSKYRIGIMGLKQPVFIARVTQTANTIHRNQHHFALFCLWLLLRGKLSSAENGWDTIRAFQGALINKGCCFSFISKHCCRFHYRVQKVMKCLISCKLYSGVRARWEHLGKHYFVFISDSAIDLHAPLLCGACAYTFYSVPAPHSQTSSSAELLILHS